MADQLLKLYEEKHKQRLWLRQIFPSEIIKLQILLKELKLRKKDVILDLGCGTGRYTTYITPNTKKCLGVDTSVFALTKIKHQTEVIRSDICHLPFKQGIFNKIYCIDTLEHIPEDQISIKEARRALTENGIILFYIPCRNPFSLEWLISKITGIYPLYPRDKEQLHLHRYTTKEVKSILTEQGFKIKKINFFLHFVSSFFNLLAAYLDRQVHKNKMRIHDKIPKTIIRIIFLLENLEYEVLKNIPTAAGSFILCQKQSPSKVHRPDKTVVRKDRE